MAETYSAGIVTAYGAAVRGGYTGTYEEFCAEQASFAENAEQVAQDREAMETLAAQFIGTTVPAAVQTVQNAGAAQIQAVEAASETEQQQIAAQGAAQETRVTQAGSDQVAAIQAAGETQVGNVNAAGTTQVGNVNTAGTIQVNAVQAKGQEVIDSIPEDFTDLQNEVGDLKSALFNSGGSAIVQYSSLPVFSAGFMNRYGTITSGSVHEVLSMPVGAAESIRLSLLTALSGGLSLIVLKDSADNVVSDCRTMTAQTEYQFDIPSGYSDGTLYFNWFNYAQETYVNQATVTYGETAKFADKTEVEKKADRLLFAGKKVYFFGDSIVAGYTSGTTTTPNSFPKIFADAVGAVLSNYGVASSSFCGGYPFNQTVITIPAKIQATDLSDADYIFIAGGVNDCQIGATETDFNAAISSLMTWLKSNVSVPVVFILPTNFSRTFASQIHPLELYRQYLSVYAEANGYKVIHTDGYGFPEGASATATELAQLLYGDGLHPTEFGHQVYGMALAQDVNLAVDAK